jgi:hypothetical protein
MPITGSGLGLDITLGSRPAYEPEALALFARMTTPPDARRKGLINTLIAGLKHAGVWSRLDAFYMLAAHTAQAARLNWVADAYNLTPVNTPAFEVDRGYTGNGLNAYLDTGFNPVTSGGKFALNDAHLGVWCLTDAAEDKNDIGNTNARIFARTAASAISGRMNDSIAPSPLPPAATSVGHTIFTRAGAAGYRIDKGGINRATPSNSSTSMASANFWVAGANGGNHCTKQIAASHFGSCLDGENVVQTNSALRSYLTSVGAP